MSTFNDRIGYDYIEVNSDKLSNYINQEIDFLKMDIEGSEIDVIRELSINQKMKYIKEATIEFHHNFPSRNSELGQFLSILEKNNFSYQIDADLTPLSSKGIFQNILLRVYKN